MSSHMNTILIIGGTSGIGECFARRWHSAGKKLILTGRRKEKLQQLEQELPGTRTYSFDVTDTKTTSSHIDHLFEQFPDIDTVWINSGQGNPWSIKDVSSFDDEKVVQEITTNITGPVLLARHSIPKLLEKQTTTTFMITGSGLGFAPNGDFPTYSPTKAFVHHFITGIRGSLKDTNVNVIEIVPPLIKTPFHDHYADQLQGVSMPSVEEFTDEILRQLNEKKPEDLKEVAFGTAIDRVDAWRAGPGKYMVEKGIPG